ncbi:hypothetical protein V6N13_092913 [Hibiscus sabdariffa]
MEEGFQVKWKENTEACRKCNASGGACGFDSFGRPLCYCPQYQSHDECGHRDHVRSKGKLKENAAIISISVIVTGGIALLAFWFYVRKINVREAGVHENRDTIFHVMDFATIAFATNNFSSNNNLGQGRFGPVYKGTLDGGQQIAVKKLAKSSNQGLEELKNEVTLISKLQHRNLIKLLGYCITSDENMLIYE